MKYILLMTCAGSVLYLGCLLAEKALEGHMSRVCMLRMLKVSVLVYLVPWEWMKNIYIPIKTLFDRESAAVAGGKLISLDNMVYCAPGKVAVTRGYGNTLEVVGVWMIIAVVIMLCKCLKYFMNRHDLLSKAEPAGEGIPEEMASRLRRELHLKRKVRIFRINSNQGNLTLGAIRPVVFVQGDCKESELEYILRHELTHIAKGDMLAKLVMELVCCLHWFNPLVYRLREKLDRTCELACDERVAQGMSKDERQFYASLIIRCMTKPEKKQKKKMVFGNFLSSGEKFAEERIRVIMQKKKGEFWEKIVVAGVFAVMVFANSLTALAYPQVSVLEDAPDRMVQELKRDVTATLVVGTPAGDPAAEVLYDRQFVLPDGEIIPAEFSAEPQFICFHSWEDALYQEHERHSDGSCVMMTYSCKHCTKCDKIKLGGLLTSNTFERCPH